MLDVPFSPTVEPLSYAPNPSAPVFNGDVRRKHGSTTSTFDGMETGLATSPSALCGDWEPPDFHMSSADHSLELDRVLGPCGFSRLSDWPDVFQQTKETAPTSRSTALTVSGSFPNDTYVH